MATAQSRNGTPSVLFNAEIHHPKWGAALSPGAGDEVLVRFGATTVRMEGQPVGPAGPIGSFSATVPDGQGNAEIVFVRQGREHTLRVPLSAPAEIVAPSEIVKGDKVTIDLTPRPAFAEGTRVEVAINNLRVTGLALPFILDTATLERTTAADSADGEPETLSVVVMDDTAPAKAVSGGGGLSVSSSVFTSRTVKRHIPLRL